MLSRGHFHGRAHRRGRLGLWNAQDGQGFDEGSTITQVQGLRGAETRGFRPSEIIEGDQVYRTLSLDGMAGINRRGGGGRRSARDRLPFQRRAVDSQYVPKLQDYCRKNLASISNRGFGHWHYAHYYYAQVQYREGGKTWEDYRDRVFDRIVSEANPDGSWSQGYIGPVYTTAINLTILQLETRRFRSTSAERDTEYETT